MKKNLVFGMMGALALAFSACTSSNEVKPGNTTAEGEAVHTQFAISFPKMKATRMTAGDAQEDEKFSGISDMKLYPFVAATVANDATIDYDVIPLGSLATKDDFSESGANHMSKVFDVPVPLGTKSFLFYGKKTSTKDGELTATFPEKGAAVTGINFALVPIQEKAITAMAQDANGAKVLAALNAVETALATDASLAEVKAAFEANTAGAAASVAALLADLSETLGKSNAAVYKTAKEKVDAQIAALKGNTFPRTIGLPDGAVSVAYTAAEAGATAAGTFAFALNDNKGLGSPALESYTKPAELYYFANTPILVDTENHEAEYPTKATWEEVLRLYDGGAVVTNTTKSVALVKPINYGVAQLQSSVKLAAGDIKDNAGTIVTPNFDVKGVLVLSQKNVDWKFQPTGDAKYVVYDAVQTGGENVTVSTTATAPNYTLVLESAEDNIQVAVELENKGEDFQGYEGQIIPTGTRFYLVGKLTKANAVAAADGEASTATEIFQQDYKTIVNFTIGATSLKNAYNTVPDLRTPQLELGLTVDLKWQKGLTFEPVLGE